MKTLFAVLCFSAFALAQQASPAPAAAAITLTAPPVLPSDGSPITVSVGITGAAAANIAAVEIPFALPAGSTIQPGAAPSPAAQAAGKGLYCGDAVCVLVGLSPAGVVSNNPLASDGVIATIPISVPAGLAAPMAIAISGPMAVDPTGATVAVTPPAPVSVNPPSKCDATGDGLVTYADAVAVLNAIVPPPGTAPQACPLAAGCSLNTLTVVVQAALSGNCPLK